MVVILRENYNEEQRDNLVNWLESLGITVHSSLGEHNTVLGLVGDTSGIDIDLIKALDIVEDVKRIQEPYKNANRKFHPEDTVVVIDEEKISKSAAATSKLSRVPAPLNRKSRYAASRRRFRSPAQLCFAAARSSPAPRPTLSRDCAQRVSSSCSRQRS